MTYIPGSPKFTFLVYNEDGSTTKTTFSAYNKMEAYAYMEEHYKHLKYEKIDD
jgi:uncharacterized protein YxeA